MDARLSNEAMLNVLAKACLLDQPDPAAAWRAIRDEQQKLCYFFATVDEFRIVNPGTDLTLSVKGRGWINGCGEKNIPDGEVFSAPVETSVNCTAAFSFPSQGIEGITLTFKDGAVTDFDARSRREHLAANNLPTIFSLACRNICAAGRLSLT